MTIFGLTINKRGLRLGFLAGTLLAAVAYITVGLMLGADAGQGAVGVRFFSGGAYIGGASNAAINVLSPLEVKAQDALSFSLGCPDCDARAVPEGGAILDRLTRLPGPEGEFSYGWRADDHDDAVSMAEFTNGRLSLILGSGRRVQTTIPAYAGEVLLDSPMTPPLELTAGGAALGTFSRTLTSADDGRTLIISISVINTATPSAVQRGVVSIPTEIWRSMATSAAAPGDDLADAIAIWVQRLDGISTFGAVYKTANGAGFRAAVGHDQSRIVRASAYLR